MASSLPNNMVGRPVKGSNFFGRDKELRRIWDRLQTDHLQLSAPRRVGKTSLMFSLLEKASHTPGWTAVYLSVEDCRDERDFIAQLFAEVAKTPRCESVGAALGKSRWTEAFSKIASMSVASITLELRERGPQDWLVMAAQLEEALFGLPPTINLLIMLDELPVFLLRLLKIDPERARVFLHWFRSLRQGSAQRSDNLRWLMAGSIGLGPLSRREGWSANFNDVNSASIGEFDTPTAQKFLSKLAERYQLQISEEASSILLERVGWVIPYYLQLFISEFRNQDLETVGVTEVDAAFETLVRSQEGKRYFAPWWERLVDELGVVDAGMARKVLAVCARDPAGAAPASVQAVLEQGYPEAERESRYLWLIDILENDGYIIKHNERWRFRSPLLREFWLGREQA